MATVIPMLRFVHDKKKEKKKRTKVELKLSRSKSLNIFSWNANTLFYQTKYYFL